jgi:uncharacterized protein (TIGR02145 family)
MMKKIIYFTLFFVLSLEIYAQNDTVFIMRHGMIVYQKALTEIDSVLFSRPVFNPHGQILDQRDSTLYATIIIGNQLWMAENLRYLPSVNTPNDGSVSENRYYVSNYWGTDPLLAKATCAYEDYGVLYNWKAATTACPPGWHLPSLTEWNTMIAFLGDSAQVGLALKETGTFHWNAPNTASTNLAEFNAIPGGSRDQTQLSFYDLGNFGYWWCQNGSTSSNSFVKQLRNDSNGIHTLDLPKEQGYSVRCIVDLP